MVSDVFWKLVPQPPLLFDEEHAKASSRVSEAAKERGREVTLLLKHLTDERLPRSPRARTRRRTRRGGGPSVPGAFSAYRPKPLETIVLRGTSSCGRQRDFRLDRAAPA